MDAYQSMTRQFRSDELQMLHDFDASILVPSLLRFDPIIGLRAAAEVMLNEDYDKLRAMLGDEIFVAHWRKFADDPQVDSRDREYAEQLEAFLMKMNE